VLQCVAVCCSVLQRERKRETEREREPESVRGCDFIQQPRTLWSYIESEPHVNLYTGWRRCIACLSCRSLSAKTATDFWALLRKMTYKHKASYDSTPPCNMVVTPYNNHTYVTLQHTATHCNALQRTATHCNTLQHTATHCNAL